MRATQMIPDFWQEVAQGALPTLYAATSPDAVGGGYYGPGGFAELTGKPTRARMPRRAQDEKTAQQFWQVAEQLTLLTGLVRATLLLLLFGKSRPVATHSDTTATARQT